MKFNKLKILLGAFAIISLIFITACGSSDPDSSSSEEANDKTYTLTYNIMYNSSFVSDSIESFNPEDDPKYIAVEMFAEKVKEATDGQVIIEPYYSNQLVPPDQMMDALASGTIDLGNAAPYYYGDIIRTAEAFNLPYWAQSYDQVHHILRETEFSEIFERELEDYGVKLLFHWYTAEQGIISKDPIRSIDDMRGKTFRIEGGLHNPWYEAMGTAPANVAAAEQYEALQRGTVDGIMFPYYSIASYNFGEVANYLTRPGVFNPVTASVFMSKNTWEELPEDLQKTIEEVSMEMEQKSNEVSKKLSEESLRIAEEKGVEVIELSDEEHEKFVESSQIIWDNLASENEDLAQMVEILRESMEE